MCTYCVYLVEHIFLEVQLCIEMLIFKEKQVFPILIILCLVTSLMIHSHHYCHPMQALYMFCIEEAGIGFGPQNVKKTYEINMKKK